MNTSNYKAIMAELKNEYLESFDEKFVLLQQYYDQKDWDRLELEYHKLKGTGATYGVPEVSELCEQLERLCREQKSLSLRLLHNSIELLKKIRTKYNDDVEFDLSSDPHFQETKKL